MSNLRNRGAKLPEIILTFWIIKIAATTLGETGGDTLSMSLHLGYAVSTLILFVLLITTITVQIRANEFHPFLYWMAVVATTLAGTTMADFADRSLGIGYIGGSSLLFAMVMISLTAWRLTSGSVGVTNIISPKTEAFYWATILFSNTLGTALGDLVSNDTGLGFAGGAIFFASILLVIAGLYYFTRLSHTGLFWAAFVLTRPLGATCGDLLTKPAADGGFDLSRPASTALIAIFMIIMVLLAPQRAGGHPGEQQLA
jgi:uncharacterized membrane-anchored protein